MFHHHHHRSFIIRHLISSPRKWESLNGKTCTEQRHPRNLPWHCVTGSGFTGWMEMTTAVNGLPDDELFGGWTRYINPDAIHRSAHGRVSRCLLLLFRRYRVSLFGPPIWVRSMGRESFDPQPASLCFHSQTEGKKGRDFNGAVRCKDAVHSDGPPFHSVINEPVETLLLGFTCSFSLDV